jgi:hypothetical protein
MMISKDPHGPRPAAITIRSWVGLSARMTLPFVGYWSAYGIAVIVLGAHVPVIAYCTVAAAGGILLLYRACRHGVRFDDTGITVRNFYRTHKLSWHDVSRFTDGEVRELWEGKITTCAWAALIVLNNGHSVIAEGTARDKESNVRRVLATIDQVGPFGHSLYSGARSP